MKRVELAGSFRRRRETVGDLDLLVCGGDREEVMTAFTTHGLVAEVLGRGDTKSSIKLRSGLQVDLRLVPEDSFGAALMYFTGSKEHNIQLRKIAIERGMSLNEYGLTRDGRTVASRTEEDVYRALGMAWIPPELREARNEIDLARQGRLPALLERKDLIADLHMHTNRTDGRESIVDMVKAARERGHRYVAITDHSQALAMAGGFDEARVVQSVAEIEEARRQFDDIQILHGLEVDILAEGALDLADEALELLDWVIVSLHSRLDQPADAVTARVLKAIEHPAVCAVGHPAARIIARRPAAAIDFEAVFRRAAALGVAMEINAQPDRLDLSDANARLAKERGVPLTINTDAHRVHELDFLDFGVFVARRAGLTKDDVLNALPYDRFRAAIRKKPKTGAVVAAAAKPGGARKPAPAPRSEPKPRKTGARAAAKQPRSRKAAAAPSRRKRT